MVNQTRLQTANNIMGLLFPEPTPMRLTVHNNRINLFWIDYKGESHEKKWECRHGSWYPTIHKKVPTGGTHITAISQLVNWVRDRPVLPVPTWEHWCSDTVGMKPKDEILSILRNSDYPQKYECQWCGSPKNLDWYDFGKHSGLGCRHSSRCETLSDILKKYQESR